MRCSDGLAHDLERILEVFSRDVHDEHSRERGSSSIGYVEVNGRPAKACVVRADMAETCGEGGAGRSETITASLIKNASHIC